MALKGVTQVKPKKSGMRKGHTLDRDLTQWVEHQTLRDCPRLSAVVSHCKERGWTPLATQVPLGCTALRLGTLADLVVEDGSGKCVLLEIQSGFDDYVDVANQGTFEFPWQDLPVSFRHKHLLQLLATAWLFVHSRHPFSHKELVAAHVLRVYENTEGEIALDTTALPFWMFGNKLILQSFLSRLRASRNETLQHRKRKMTNGSRRALASRVGKRQRGGRGGRRS
jgi:hypothetical protein